jgi:GT2 family glycosyltransferase
MEKFNDITFVVIGLNEEDTLDKCFKSIKNITDNIIYVDSNSTDKSIQIAKDNNIEKIVRLDSNYYSATLGRYVGAKYVVTKYIQFLDGDMIVDENWINIAIEKLGKEEDVAAVLGYKKVYNKNFRDYYLLKDEKEYEPDYMGGAFCINAEKYREVGEFDLNLPAEEERDLYVRLKHNGYKVKYIHTLMASHFDFKSQGRTLLYSIFSFRSASIFLPLINSIKNNTLLSWAFVYKKSIPTLIIDILSLIIFIFMLFEIITISVSIFIIVFSQILSIVYSIKIKRKGYFIIWKSGLLSIFKMFKIMKRDIQYTIEKIK